jgi:hypothetical protein
MTQPDGVRRYLEERGCDEMRIAAGLDGLVERWAEVVDAVQRGYDLTLDDYLDDMDGRDILVGALAAATEKEREAASVLVDHADQLFLAATRPCGPVWGPAVAEEDHHDPDRQWWYFRCPRYPGPMLEDELVADGLIPPSEDEEPDA